EGGRAAVQTVLEARVSPSLFAPRQMTRLIVASGGNLRDLFALVLEAGEGARQRNPLATVIGADDATSAIGAMRREYRMRLGESPYDRTKCLIRRRSKGWLRYITVPPITMSRTRSCIHCCAAVPL